jgi:GNAT superfamily N-acetyltransferase
MAPNKPLESVGIILRRGSVEDTAACHSIMWHAITDFAQRRGMPMTGTADDWWAGSEREFTYLARTAAEWWIAEDSATHAVIGYARSIQRGGLFELTEFFVHPGQQAKGVGRALLARAFRNGRGEVRSIIATTDVPALGRYYAADTVARFPILTLTGAPADAPVAAGVGILQVDGAHAPHLAEIAAIERAAVGFLRGEEELRWILERRDGYLYRRGERALAFAFVGADGAGPVAALEPGDLVPALLHVESRAHALGVSQLSLQVPSVNGVAIRHLLARGFRIDSWVNLLMSNRPFGQFDRFIAFSPVFL